MNPLIAILTLLPLLTFCPICETGQVADDFESWCSGAPCGWDGSDVERVPGFHAANSAVRLDSSSALARRDDIVVDTSAGSVLVTYACEEADLEVRLVPSAAPDAGGPLDGGGVLDAGPTMSPPAEFRVILPATTSDAPFATERVDTVVPGGGERADYQVSFRVLGSGHCDVMEMIVEVGYCGY